MSEQWAAAWDRLVRENAPDDPRWIVCGKGGRTSLVRQPVGWWLYQIGFSSGAHGAAGNLDLSSEPLTKPPAGSLAAFGGLSQARHKGPDDPDRRFDPREDTARADFTWWVGVADARIAEQRTPDQWAAFSEEDFVNDRDEVPFRWTMLAGWRLLHGSGDPVEVIDAAVDLLTSRDASERDLVFWRDFRDVCTAGARGDAVSWLDVRRHAWLSDLGVAADAISAR